MKSKNLARELRFYNMEPMSGAFNMAVDEALAETLMTDKSHAYLRFYQWQPSCLSFGYNQPIKKLVKLDEVQAVGLDVVRRASGGKMVFHDKEFTFSMGLPVSLVRLVLGSGATFIEMFHLAMKPIVEALKELGVPARFSNSSEISDGSKNFVHCYGSVAGHSVFAGDKKLIGAAGFYRRGSLVIHGSIPIKVAFPPAEIFQSTKEASLDIKMTALSEFLSSNKTAKLPRVVGTHFAEALALPLKLRRLSQPEIAYSQKLEKEKYNNPTWLHKK